MSASSNAPDSSWTDARRVAALRKWHASWVAFSRPATDLIVQALAPAAGLRVLDLASGAGEPALSIASAVGPAGRVVATDLGADVLALAEEDARAHGVANLECKLVDAQFLPFLKESFDAVTCRFGLMFFPNCDRALRECRRVLAPGGKAVFLVWGRYDQPFWQATIGVLGRYVHLPEIPSDAPHIFRFAEPDKLMRAMQEAGFDSVREDRVSLALAWPGSPRNFWTYFTESSGQYRLFMEKLTKENWENAARDVENLLAEHFDGQQLNLATEVVLATGIRS
jgi:ubiquinone/menaquinone biosynthesis C-methylase UbiE